MKANFKNELKKGIITTQNYEYSLSDIAKIYEQEMRKIDNKIYQNANKERDIFVDLISIIMTQKESIQEDNLAKKLYKENKVVSQDIIYEELYNNYEPKEINCNLDIKYDNGLLTSTIQTTYGTFNCTYNGEDCSFKFDENFSNIINEISINREKNVSKTDFVNEINLDTYSYNTNPNKMIENMKMYIIYIYNSMKLKSDMNNKFRGIEIENTDLLINTSKANRVVITNDREYITESNMYISYNEEILKLDKSIKDFSQMINLTDDQIPDNFKNILNKKNESFFKKIFKRR